MMVHRPIVVPLAALLGMLWCLNARLLAQSHEEQALTILTLFDQGKTDTAYALLEPLKRSARFVPAVLYVRAHMTPDDRALGLYREVIALEPSGEWADNACGALVARYVDKKDSTGAAAWLAVMRTNYARSPLLARAEQQFANTQDWLDFFPEPSRNDRLSSRDDSVASRQTSTRSDGKPSASDSYSKTGMKGFALQVGLFPTRESAERRASELRAVGLKPAALPKMVAGKRSYAIVVGPYSSIAEANRRKPEVARLCDCKAFIVRVQ